MEVVGKPIASPSIRLLSSRRLNPGHEFALNPFMPQNALFTGLKKLRVKLAEEEPVGREVANLRFLTNAVGQAGLLPGGGRDSKREDNYQIFNSDPQSQFFHLESRTGMLRIARRIDRDQLCPTFRSCCPSPRLDDAIPAAAFDVASGPPGFAELVGIGTGYVDGKDSGSTNTQLPECRLDLNVRSDDQYSKIILVHVHIEDINDNAPVWPQFSTLSEAFVSKDNDGNPRTMLVKLSENSLIDDSIALAPAYDADLGTNGIVRYTLTPVVPEFTLKWLVDMMEFGDRLDTAFSSGSNSRNPIAGENTEDEMDPTTKSQSPAAAFLEPPDYTTGQRHELRLVVKKSLDRETQAAYDFTLTAYDGGSPARNASVPLRVLITDANDNSPKFQKDTYVVELRENARPHTPVIQIILTVEAVDSGTLPRASTCIVEILVRDENDHSPEIRFEPAHLTNYALVPENEKPGRLVAVFTATDQDSGENGRVACQLTEPHKWRFDTADQSRVDAMLSNPLNSLFKLQQMHVPFSVMYKLTTASMFDRELTARILVWIVCSDFGQPPRNTTGSVSVRITDVNDERPRFSRSSYYHSVREDTALSTPVFMINATDEDEGENAQLAYWLTGQDADFFQVNEKNGQVSVRRLLDRESRDLLTFQIHCTDHGSPALNASAEVIVAVTDVNDNAPEIPEHIEFSVMENHTAAVPVGKIIVTDKDLGKNAEVSFSLIQCFAHLPATEDFQLSMWSGQEFPSRTNFSAVKTNEMLYT
ncbi:unnamed protein product [Echinostoma caproni]|uniref:Cadherin domain-containing protein n=1 Tax=Echinostoma caproni TaxID=27848 RepID=A0A183A5F5_9TREM|nr:unnamed protein product [Echinostoma caproni]